MLQRKTNAINTLKETRRFLIKQMLLEFLHWENKSSKMQQKMLGGQKAKYRNISCRRQINVVNICTKRKVRRLYEKNQKVKCVAKNEVQYRPVRKFFVLQIYFKRQCLVCSKIIHQTSFVMYIYHTFLFCHFKVTVTSNRSTSKNANLLALTHVQKKTAVISQPSTH